MKRGLLRGLLSEVSIRLLLLVVFLLVGLRLIYHQYPSFVDCLRGQESPGLWSEVLTGPEQLCVFLPLRVTEQLPPFNREIQPEEMWLYKFHRVENDHVPTTLMFVSILCVCVRVCTGKLLLP